MSGTSFLIPARRDVRKLALVFCALVLTNYPLRGGVTADGTATSDGKSTTAAAATTEEETTEYKNWIELGVGGVITHGDTAQFEQEHHTPGDQVYGGITDMHYEHGVGEKATLTIDGHALWDINDYDIKVKLEQAKVGYIAAGFTEFRSWYDGNGGFFPPAGGTWFRPFFPEMHIDRGDAWVELGIRLPDWPEITLRYSHEFRNGQKDSTTWGDTTLTGLTTNPNRKIIPSFRDIDETRDIFALDISKTFGNTDVLLGMRYEHNDNDDSLNMERGVGQALPLVDAPGVQRFVTQHEHNNLDLFSGHAITETRLTDSLWFTAGYSYTTLGSDLSGTRIFGTHSDAAFGQPVPSLDPFDQDFINLAGTTEVKDHVINANIFWMPLPTLSVLTAFRYTHENEDGSATFLSLEPEPNVPLFTPTNPAGGFHFGAPTLTFGERSQDYDRFAERFELRYTGIANWLFYVQGEWEEECGHVDEIQSQEEELLDKDTHFLAQKYTAGANWYPMTRLNLSAQYYHKIADYDNDIHSGQHQRLLGQDWGTDDVNVRLTWRPKIPNCLGTLALVSRYDFVRTTIDSKWFFEGETLDEERSGTITQHMITEAITWNPLARLYFQTDVAVALNQTETPASNIILIPNASPTILDFRNDYWTVTAAAGYIIDNKTDVRADYTFYRANDYTRNAQVGMPYGMGATEHTASLTLTRQLNKSMRLMMRYTYFTYDEETSGFHNNYEAHSIFSGLQYRF